MSEETRRSDAEIWDGVWSSADLSAAGLHAFAADFYRCLVGWLTPYRDRDARVLEPGAGTGRFSRALAKGQPGWDVVALDRSEASRKFYEQAGAPSNLAFVCGDMFHMPFPDASFDVVFNEGVVEHFPNYQEAIDEMARVLKPGGMMVVAVPNLGNVWHTRHKRRAGEAYEYGFEKSFTARELRDAVRTAGLQDRALEGFDPAYGLERLQARGVPDAEVRARRWRRLVAAADAVSGRAASRRAGFEIAVLAVKP